jgi:hypothetical protein
MVQCFYLLPDRPFFAFPLINQTFAESADGFLKIAARLFWCAQRAYDGLISGGQMEKRGRDADEKENERQKPAGNGFSDRPVGAAGRIGSGGAGAGR